MGTKNEVLSQCDLEQKKVMLPCALLFMREFVRRIIMIKCQQEVEKIELSFQTFNEVLCWDDNSSNGRFFIRISNRDQKELNKVPGHK